LATFLVPTYPLPIDIGVERPQDDTRNVANGFGANTPGANISDAGGGMLRLNLGNPVTGANLFGRARVIERAWERLETGANLQLMAPRRVGKTSVMLELQRVPRDGWTAIYLNLESEEAPGGAFAQITAAIALHRQTRTWFESAVKMVPFRGTIQDVLKSISSVGIGELKVDLQNTIGDDWRGHAEKLAARLAALPKGQRLLLVLDELPILVGRLFRSPAGPEQAKLFLETLRHLRQRPELAHRVQFLIGGSVGLHTILGRHGASATANDLEAVKLEPWSRPTATTFLEKLGAGENFPLPDAMRDGLLDLLDEDLIPFHVQLLFKALRDAADGQPQALDARLLDKAFRDVARDPYLNHYAERLDDHLSPEDVEVARRVLGALSAAGAGFAPGDLLRKAEVDGGRAGPVIRVLEDEGYLTIGEDSGIIRFRSEILRRFWLRRQAPFDGEYR
jgi:hypothetical protein